MRFNNAHRLFKRLKMIENKNKSNCENISCNIRQVITSQQRAKMPSNFQVYESVVQTMFIPVILGEATVTGTYTLMCSPRISEEWR